MISKLSKLFIVFTLLITSASAAHAAPSVAGASCSKAGATNIYLGKINPALLFIISFIFLIITGTGLLLLPNATTNGISLIDALFTSTSAVCVTGLASVDTQFAFTALGKGVILMLIQLGGLGVMTFTSFFGLFFLKARSFLQHSPPFRWSPFGFPAVFPSIVVQRPDLASTFAMIPT